MGKSWTSDAPWLQVRDKANVEPIFKHLLQIMRFTEPNISKADARRLAKEQLKAFCERWAHEAAFVAYFKKEWGDKLGA